MPYQYRYIPSGAPIQNSAKQEFFNLTQEDLNQMFYESDDVYTIEEETSHASGVYRNVDVRINKVVNLQTGERVGDDFKKILFKDIDHSVDLGRLYRFHNNYWISINVEKINTLTNTVTVRRCNNTLRWMDENGGIHTVPCSIGNLIKENRDYSTAGSNMVVPSGMIDVLVQQNSLTDSLKPNQRFLIGNAQNWTAYRIEGGGISNFNNQNTEDNNSAGMIRLNMAIDYTNNHDDDLVNGIADVGAYEYVISLNQSAISGDADQSVQLQAIVTVNGKTTSRTLVWESSNESVATVDEDGLVTFIGEGNAVITCSLTDRDDVNDTCAVTVGQSPVDNYQIIYSPTANYILEGESRTYTVYLYKNGVQQADAFSFSLDANTVPSTKYTYEVLGDNSFRITNHEMFLTDSLDITCTSGAREIVVQVDLRGAW